MDADDTISPNLKAELARFRQWTKHPNAQAFQFPCVDTDSNQMAMQTRLFRNMDGINWQKPIHETVDESMRELGIRPVGYTNQAVYHTAPKAQEEIDRKQIRNLRILEKMPASTWKSYQMASSYAAMGLWSTAIHMAERAMEEAKGARGPLPGYLQFFIGYCLHESGKRSAAVPYLEESDFPDAMFLLAEIEHEDGHENPTLYHDYLKAEIPTTFPSFARAWLPKAITRLEKFVRAFK
jgi:hypothetical protein